MLTRWMRVMFQKARAVAGSGKRSGWAERRARAGMRWLKCRMAFWMCVVVV
jgi:hypothetical protein